MKNLKKFNEMEQNIKQTNIDDNKIVEFFGGADGTVDIKINGQGTVKNIVIKEIIKSLKNIGGKINLYIDDEKVDIHQKNGMM